MLNRIGLVLVCTLSLGWIFYVGYDVFYKTDRLNPELIFDSSDTELLIINRTDEYFETKIDFEIVPEIRELAHQFIQTPRNERIFCSKTRDLLLIESPNYWSKSSVITYLNRKGIAFQEKDKKLFVGNYQLTFKYHFLLVAPSNFKKSGNEFNWSKWDKKASAVIVHLGKNSYLTEIYLQENGQVMYQTTFNNELKTEKVDDKNVFAPFIPQSISSYHFFEKNYAKLQRVVLPESPMNDWLQYGFVFFDYNGNTVLITDSKTGEDPLNTLNTRFAKDTATFVENQAIKGLKLTSTFPTNTANGFYLSRVGDKVIFSENLDLNKKIIADYELGNTLLLHPEKADLIYGKLPYKVNERFISSTSQFAIATHANISTKHVVQTENVTNSTVVVKPETNQHFILPINGTILQVEGKGNQQYVLTSTHILYAINNGKVSWQENLNEALIGKIKLVDYEGSGKIYILANTNKKAFLWNEQGSNLLENLSANFQNELNFYRWKNVSNFIMADAGKVSIFNEQGKFNKPINHQAGNTTHKIEVFAQNGQIIGLITGDRQTQTINLGTNKVVKSHPVLPVDAIRFKSNGTVNLFDLQNSQLVKLDYASKKTELGSFKDAKSLRFINTPTANYLSLIGNHKLTVFNDHGVLVKAIELPTNDIQSYDLCLVNGQFFFTFLDGLENKIIVTDANGKVLQNNLEGKNSVAISARGNAITVTSEGNGYLVQYYNVLNQ